MNYTTINGHEVKTHDYRDHRVPSHARRLCGALERDHDAVERIDYTGQTVCVWMDQDHEQESFEIPAGWSVVQAGVFGTGVAIDLQPNQ